MMKYSNHNELVFIWVGDSWSVFIINVFQQIGELYSINGCFIYLSLN